MSDSTRRAGDEMGKMGGKLDAIRDAAGGILGVFGGLAAAITAAGGAAIVSAAKYEQTEMAFTTLLGSGQKAQSFLKDLANFAANTPFDLTGLQSSSQQLLAFGFQAKDVIPIMTSVGDSISALGGGEEEISRVVAALGKGFCLV
ncbi:tape measure protein [Priestia sp. JV24]|uniref:tape measure protein n=2 Tax=Priestia TaxID=2800373 RepID=UPI00221FA9EF|nr:tape measure protein [Priestia sp. JV24]MCW1049187.1 tape measure protein [Priestia sp. JV24]